MTEPSETNMLHNLQKNLQNEGKERFERASSLYTALTGRQFFNYEDPALDLFTLLVVAQMISNEDTKKDLNFIIQKAVRKEMKELNDEKESFSIPFLILTGITIINLFLLIFLIYKIV